MAEFILVVSLVSLLVVVIGFYWISRDHEEKMDAIYKRHQESMKQINERHSQTMESIYARYKGKA